MAFETITRQNTRYPQVQDERGLHAASEWSVYALSADGVRTILKNTQSIERGAVYKDEQGSIPDAYCRCQRIEVSVKAGQPSGGAYALFEAVCIFGPPSGSSSSRANPLTGEPYWWLEGEFVSKPVDHDVHGKPIQYTNQEPVDPVLTADFVSESANVEMYISADSQPELWAMFRPYHGKVNTDAYKGADAGTLRCKPFQIQPSEFVDDAGKTLYLVRGCFEYRTPQVYNSVEYPAWSSIITNKGKRLWKYDLQQDKWVFENIKDAEGNDVSEQVLIDEGGVDVIPRGGTAVLLKWDHYSTIDFSTLPF